MRVVFALLQLISLLIAFFFEYKRKSPMVFCWGVLIIMFGGMHFFSSVNIKYQYDSNVLNEASVFVILFCIIYIAIRIAVIKASKRVCDTRLIMDENAEMSSENKETQAFVNLLDILLLISVLMYIAIIMKESGGRIRFDKTIVYSSMEQHTRWILLSTYLYFSSAPILLYHLYKHQTIRSVYAILLVAGKTAASLSRMDMVFIIVSIVGYMILMKAGKEWITLLLLAAMVIVFIYTLYAIRVFRNLMMDPQYTSSVSGFNEKIIDLIMKDDGDLGWRRVFYYFIENENSFEGFGTGAGYRRLLLLPIPSSLSGGLKPEDICITIGRAWHGVSKNTIEEGTVKYTMTPTLFGDCYANFGFAGCLLGGVWALLATAIDVLCSRKNEALRLMLFGLSAAMLVDVGRGAVYNSVCGIWYGSLLIFLYFFLAKAISGWIEGRKTRQSK